MKKALLIICFIGFNISTYSQTNIYHKFPISDAVWREFSGGYQSSNCSDYQYTITGDTIIGSYVYHKLQRSGVKYYEDSHGDCTWDIMCYFDDYAGAYRNDTINKKIYYFSEYLSIDTLLYDFDLSLGDTLPPSFINDSALTHNFVSLVDSVLVGNNYHRIFGVSGAGIYFDSNYVYLIEGIGSTYGLFGDLQPPFEFGSALACFIQNGSTVYPDTNHTCTLVSVEENEQILKPLIRIYPNPFNSTTQITFNKTYLSVSLSVYDVSGKIIMNKEYSNCDRIKFQRHYLENGIYIMKIALEKNSVRTIKLIVGD